MSSKLYKLDEISRKNLVGKTRSQSLTRYNKRLSYRNITYEDIEFDKLLYDDFLVIHTNVGDYITTVAFEGFMKTLIQLARSGRTPTINLQLVIRAINKAIDSTDIYVNCTCDDFKYRYEFWSTKYKYKYGSPETRPPKKTNPNDDIGATCKHLASILSNKKWLVRVSSVINNWIKKNIDDIRSMWDLSEEEFYVYDPRNKVHRDRATKKKNDIIIDELYDE